jgi:hypothetical protein
MPRESIISLPSACEEADEAAQKVTLLKGVLAVERQARDTAEAELPRLDDRAVDANWRREEVEG